MFSYLKLFSILFFLLKFFQFPLLEQKINPPFADLSSVKPIWFCLVFSGSPTRACPPPTRLTKEARAPARAPLLRQAPSPTLWSTRANSRAGTATALLLPLVDLRLNIARLRLRPLHHWGLRHQGQQLQQAPYHLLHKTRGCPHSIFHLMMKLSIWDETRS